MALEKKKEAIANSLAREIVQLLHCLNNHIISE